MFNALSGSGNAASLIALFTGKRDKTQTDDAPRTAERPPDPRPPPAPPGGNGASMQALVAAMMQALTGDKASATADDSKASPSSADAAASATQPTDADSPAGVLAALLSAIDTDGDGTLSPGEMNAAAETLQNLAPTGPPDAEVPTPTDTTAAQKTAPMRSMSQAFFEALAQQAGPSSRLTTGNPPGGRGLYTSQIAA